MNVQDEINQIAFLHESAVEEIIERCTVALEGSGEAIGVKSDDNVADSPSMSPSVDPELIEGKHRRSTLYHLRAEAYLNAQKDTMALFDVDMALSLCDANAPPHRSMHSRVLRGKILVRMEKVLDAIEELEHVAWHACDTDLIRLAHYHLGKLYSRVPLFATAAVHFGHVAQSDAMAHKLTVLYRGAAQIDTVDELQRLIHSLPQTNEPFLIEFSQNLIEFFIVRRAMQTLSHNTTRDMHHFLQSFVDEIGTVANDVIRSITSGKFEHAERVEEVLEYARTDPNMRLPLLFLGDFASSIESSVLVEFCTRKILRLQGESVNFFKDMDLVIRPHQDFTSKADTSFDFIGALEALSNAAEPTQLILKDFNTKPLRFRCVPAMEGESPSCLTESEWALLHASLEERFRQRPWSLAFNSKIHGASFMTFRHRVAHHGPTLFLIHTVDGNTLGAFIEPQVKFSPNIHFGNQSTFVFSNDKASFRKGNHIVQVYRTTGSNKYYCLFTHSYFTIGGGDNVAFRIDEDLKEVQSFPCATFGSPCLLPTARCELASLEVWFLK